MNTFLLSFLLLVQSPAIDASWSKTQHSIQVGSEKLSYQASAGTVPVSNSKGDVDGNIYYTAYTVNSKLNRPITFAWNGGPGGASILVHAYCMGPRRLFQDPKDAKSFSIVDNPNTFLTETDLVFMDPIGTGYSKADKDKAKQYWGVDGDVRATVQFIHKYLEATGRAKAPVFLAGESYGTFRAAGAARYLLNDGVDLRGMVLLSNAIRFDAFVGRSDSDLPYLAFLPTFTATAAFHKKLKPEWNAHPDRAIAAAKEFAGGDYLLALAKGDSISPKELHRYAEKLHELTSVATDYIEKHRLRIDSDEFRYRLLRADHKVVGKFDGNEIGDIDAASPAAVKAFTAYLQTELGYKSEDKYLPLSMGVNMSWDYGRAILGSPDQSDNLRSALERYQNLRVFVAQGLYDLTTAFYGVEYSYNHLGLSDAVKSHWSLRTYEGGHMMYLVPDTHTKLKGDVSAFIDECLKLGPSKS